MTAATLSLGVVASVYGAPTTQGRVSAVGIGKAMPVRGHAIRVSCNHPVTLRLIRFEDGSARLNCGRRALVRVSVPG
ncbi:MAG: hypothetical protein WBM00_10950 [Solirubrobacterales bacterium]